MDGVSPISGSSPSISAPPVSSPSIPSSSLTIQDSLQSSETAAPLSLLAFMNLVGSKNTDLQDAIRVSTDSTLTSRVPFYLQSASSGLDAIAAYSAFINYFNTASLIISTNDTAISTLSTALTAYNNNVLSDIAAVATMNTAITNYKNNTITLAEYNADVATYNTYATAQATRVSSANSAITTFNTAADTTNNNIDILNSDIPHGGEPLTHQTTYAARPSLSTISTAPPTPTSTISFSESTLTPSSTLTVTLTTLSGLLGGAIKTLIANISQNALLLQLLQNADSAFAYKIFFLTGINFNLPAAFTTPANKISVTDPGTAGGSGSSVNLSVAGSSLSSSNITDVLGHSIFISELERIYVRAFTSLNQNTSSDKIASTLNITTANLVSQMGLLSLSTAVRLLGGQGALASIDPRSSLAALAVSLGLISEIAGAISSGVFKTSILNALKKENPPLSDEEVQALASKLSSSIEIKALLLGVLNLASALNSPDLLSQLLGTVTNSGKLPPSFESNLNNPSVQQNLASSLASEAGISNEEAGDIVKASITSNAINTAELKANLSAELVKNGISKDAADKASFNSIESLKSELSKRGATQKNITKESIKGTPLDSVGVNALLDANHDSLTRAELSAKLSAEFVKSGLSETESNLAAKRLISTLDRTYSSTSYQGLADELTAKVRKNTEGETKGSQTDAIAAELLSTLFGGNSSVKELLDSRIQTIKNSSENEASKLEDDFKKFVTPDTETLGLARILGDPAMSLLFIASGIIYTPDQSPSKPGSLNRQRLGGIDMPV